MGRGRAAHSQGATPKGNRRAARRSLPQGHGVLSGKSSVVRLPSSPRLRAASSGYAFSRGAADVFRAPETGPRGAGSGRGRACPLRHPPPQSTPAGTQAGSEGPESTTNAPGGGAGPCRTHSWGASRRIARPPSRCLLGNWPLALTVPAHRPWRPEATKPRLWVLWGLCWCPPSTRTRVGKCPGAAPSRFFREGRDILALGQVPLAGREARCPAPPPRGRRAREGLARTPSSPAVP